LACCLGAAGGAWMSAMLMNSIWDYYQEATPITLLISSSLLLVVCVASVAYKIYSTVRINPALVLRDE
jgi:hypothetical protein